MTAIRSSSRHPSAGVLLRRLDGELDARTESRLARHLEHCDACRQRMEETEEQARRVGRYIRVLPAGAAVTRERMEAARAAMHAAALRRRTAVQVRRGWAVAATIAGLLVVSLSVDPLRAWVLQRLAIGDAAERSAVSTVSLPTTRVGGETSVIAFTTTGGTFELQVERNQSAGELLLQVNEVEQATAQVTNSGGETMLVLPAGLRIENSPSSSASYRVTLPTSVAEVLLRIGDDAPRLVAVPRGAAAWRQTIELTSAAP